VEGLVLAAVQRKGLAAVHEAEQLGVGPDLGQVDADDVTPGVLQGRADKQHSDTAHVSITQVT
jgi:hypothetical protein